MKNLNQLLKRFLLLQIIVAAVACDNDSPNSLEVEVTALSPTSASKYETIIISGRNFSNVIQENKVTINGKVSDVVEASTSQLKVKVPLAAGSGAVEVSVNNKTSLQKPLLEYVYTVQRYAGSYTERGTQNGVRDAARFEYPDRLISAPDGTLFVVDGAQIRKITPDGQVTSLASGQYGYADGPAATAKFRQVEAITLDNSGNLLVCDHTRIRKVSPEGIVSTIAGTDLQASIDGPLNTASFDWPMSILTDAAGNIWVGDRSKLRKISTGGFVSTVVGSDYGYKDGNGIQSMFTYFSSLERDKNNNFVVWDSNNKKLRVITPTFDVSTLGPSSIRGYYDGPLQSAQFKGIAGMAFNQQKELFITDGTMIRKLGTDGVVATIAGTEESNLRDGPTNQGCFSSASAITVTQEGVIYVIDWYTPAVRRMD